MIIETSNNSPINRSALDPQNEVGLAPEDEVSIDNIAASTLQIDRGSRLEEASNSKLSSLSNVGSVIPESQSSEIHNSPQDPYLSREGAVDQELGANLYDEYTARTSGNTGSYDPNLKPVGNSALNALSGFGSSFVNELLVKPLDAVGDLTGLYDLDKDGDTQKTVEDAFGYNAKASEEAMHNIGNYWDTASNDGEPAATRVRAVANGMLEAFTTPELLGTSFGALMSWVTPGAILKGVGVGSKFAGTALRVDKLVAAGKLSSSAGKVKKAQAFMSVDGAKSFLTSQAGFIASSLGNVNKQYEEFVANNNGAELEGQEKAEWFAGRFAVQMVNQNLDKIVDINVMKSPGVFKALVPAVKAMSEKEFASFAKVMASGVAKTSLSAGSEAAQEYVQTIMELFNSRFGSEKFRDEDTFVKFLSNEENIREAGIAAISGAGGSAQFELVGAITPAVSLGSKFVSNKTSGILADTIEEVVVDIPAVDLSEEEVKKAKGDYGALLTRVANAANKNGVNESNIGIFLEDLEVLNNTKHIISTSSDANIDYGEGIYNDVVDKLESFISNNQNLKLTKRLVRKTVKQSVEDKTTLGSKPAPETNFEGTGKDSSVVGKESEFEEVEYDDYTRRVEAERIARAVLGSGRKFSNEFKTKVAVFGMANGLSKQEVKDVIKSYAEVEEEATTGSRGYVTRLDKLKTLVESDTPDESKINKERKGVESFYQSTVKSEEALGRGITAAQQKAVELNSQTITPGKTVQIDTEYMKLNKKTGLYDVPYKINIKNIDGVWTPDIAPARRIQQLKSGTASNMLKGLQEIDSSVPSTTSATPADETDSVTPDSDITVPVLETSKSTEESTSDPIQLSDSVNTVVNTTYGDGTEKNKVQATFNTSGEAIKLMFGAVEIPTNGLNASTGTEGIRKHVADYGIVSNEFKSARLEDVPVKGVDNVTNNKQLLKDLENELGIEQGTSSVEGVFTILEEDSSKADTLTERYTKKLSKTTSTNLKNDLEELIDEISVYTSDSIPNESVETLSEVSVVPDKVAPARTTSAKEVSNTIKLEAPEPSALSQIIQTKADTAKNPNVGKAVSAWLTGLGKQEPTIALVNQSEFPAGLKTAIINTINQQIPSAATIEAVVEPNADATITKKVTESVTPKKVAEGKSRQGVTNAPAQEDKDIAGNEALTAWSSVAEEGLNSKELEKEVAGITETLGLKPKKLITDILGVKSFAKGKKDLYEAVYQNVATKQVNVKPLRKPMEDSEYDRLIKINSKPDAHDLKGLNGKFIFVGSRRVVQDMTKIVDVNKATVANSITLDFLPSDIRTAVKSFTKSAESTLLKVSPAELADQTYSRGEDGKPLPGGFNLHNSPARGLLFNNEGNINEEVMTATYLAVGDMLVSDKSTLSIGWKSNQDVARMFNVQEFEVTVDMRKFAYSHGNLLKSVANKLGKDVLTQLGINKRTDSETSSHEYESLVADIGNTALIIAEHQGLLKNTTEKSNKIAELYSDGEQRESETDTHFINLSGVESTDANSGFTKNVPTDKVDSFITDYKDAVENIPEASTTRKYGHFFKPTEDALEKARSVVRNDISGKEVPLEAQETLQILMETPYTADLVRIDEILDAVDTKGSNVKKLLGFVELTTDEYTSPEFENLYYKDKEVQEAKNNAIDKTLDELRILRDSILSRDGKNNDLYFDYFYASNDRYMMDANTINPQVDKLHRFLITPKDHKLDYSVVIGESGGLEFFVGDKDDIDSDQSFTVRMAIAQAFGQGVDKMSADDIIDYGNAMLSMSKEDISAARKEILSNGEFTLNSGGKEYEVEAEHFSHTLQALSFLEDAKKGSGKLSSSLSLEFDSLTSGFANKTQQMPIFDDAVMIQHFARTGVLTKEYQDQLEAALNYKGEGVKFDPKTGQSMADVIASGDVKGRSKDVNDVEFLDSYKNLAKTAVLKLRDNTKQNENLSGSGFSLFEAVKPMLPGGEQIASDGDITITGLIRNLFKNPFMIFNYSAGIARIVKNLSNDVAHDMAKTIATKDLDLDKNEGIKLVAENLISTVSLVNPKTDKVIGTAEEFQEVLRNNTLSDIKVKTPFMVESVFYGTEKKSRKANNLEVLLENAMGATYGEVVKEVFEENFKPFIEVQDAMNDTFKVAFRIFDKKRIDILKELQKSKADSFLSAEDHMNVLEELRDDFPWIVGPLTEEGDKKATISVATTTTRVSNAIEESRKKPQTMLAAGNGKGSRTVTPLVKYLEEAVSSGSVLPFHAIDGAEIAKTLTSMSGYSNNSTAAIHDAVIPPLNQSDRIGFEYNKGMVDINTNYSLADSLGNLVERMNKTINDPKFDVDYKDATAINTKIGEKVKKSMKVKSIEFPMLAKAVVESMTTKVDEIKAKREEWYGVNGVGGKLEGAYYGNLVGTPGGMYRTAFTDEDGNGVEATTEPDLSYKEEFKRLGKYKTPEVKLNVQESVTQPTYKGKLTSNKSLIKDMANKLGLAKGTEDVGLIIDIINSDESKADALMSRYLDKLRTVTDPKVKNSLRDLISELEFFTSDILDENVIEDIVETTSNRDAKSTSSSSIAKNLKECIK